ncbi:DUF4376 domain-containing protein [Chromohalobacter canadensis]|uniref:DUF4376 domain-containing protein n=1 Tax=Chromohalobacter canadensis TaxID=141389 RepID=UPI0021C1935E|nr:DUF4376 domain-containing protein [Chromohalobacter canadensis]MCT8467010.1 DUF4376 domain-containing protein [Chromohalobacter canadensis]
MDKYYYSPKRNKFYPKNLIRTYRREGTFPNDAVAVNEADWQTYGIGEPPAGQQLGSDASGRPCWIDIPPKPLDDLAARKRREIATALADALAAGMPYTMPDGSEDTVQMLAEDRQNLLGLAIEARDLRAAGETGAVQEFRAKSNTRYPMTPDQTIALTDAALGHYKLLKAQSWDRKNAIAAALEAEDRDALEAIDW